MTIQDNENFNIKKVSNKEMKSNDILFCCTYFVILLKYGINHIHLKCAGFVQPYPHPTTPQPQKACP